MILEIDSVELYFANKRILNGIYLKAEKGKVTGVLGRNGEGKSSLLRVIFGDLIPKYKLIRLDGKPILKPLYKTNLIAYLPQHQLTPNTIKIKTLFKFLKIDWLVFIEHFESFAAYQNNKMNALSGGERRVLEIYLILKSDKPIILLDEPFSHIAPIYIEKIKELINAEKKTKSIILTDHFYKDVIDSSDELYLLKNGCTHLIDKVEELEDYQYLSAGMLS